jgi:hypothetical protein
MNNPSDDNRMAAGSIPARGPNVATVPDQVYKKYIYIYIVTWIIYLFQLLQGSDIAKLYHAK